jgi:hypothetical protein
MVEEDSKLETGNVFTGPKIALSKVTSENAAVLPSSHSRKCEINNMHRHAQFAGGRETNAEQRHLHYVLQGKQAAPRTAL